MVSNVEALVTGFVVTRSLTIPLLYFFLNALHIRLQSVCFRLALSHRWLPRLSLHPDVKDVGYVIVSFIFASL